VSRPLRDVLNDEDYWARRFALSEARKSGDVDALVRGLTDPDHRSRAADFLGELGDTRAVVPLQRLLEAADSDIRASAAIALGKIGSSAAVDRLLEIAEADEVLAVRTWAISALGEIGDKAAAPRLARVLIDPEPRIRALAAEALGRIGDTSSIEAIQRQRSAEPWRLPWRLRRRYSRALRALKRARLASH
jgi:HEAT repeat protein